MSYDVSIINSGQRVCRQLFIYNNLLISLLLLPLSLQMTDFSDSSQSSMLSPASTLIESFNKKSGSPLPSQLSSQSSGGTTSNSLCTVTPTLNGSVANGGANGTGAGTVASVGGRQINTSSSSCSSLKETSHQSTSTSQQVSKSHFVYEYYVIYSSQSYLNINIRAIFKALLL